MGKYVINTEYLVRMRKAAKKTATAIAAEMNMPLVTLSRKVHNDLPFRDAELEAYCRICGIKDWKKCYKAVD